MEALETFKRLLPAVARVEPLTGSGGLDFFKAFDAAGELVAYGFMANVPETVPDIPGMDEMDRYFVNGVVDPKDRTVIAIEVLIDPEGPEDVWEMKIIEPEFAGQYVGLTVAEIDLSPDGKIDAISDATLSSTWITNAVRDKVDEILKMV